MEASVPSEWADDVSEVLLPASAISRRVSELGSSLSTAYAGLNLVLVTVLKGSWIFAADLSRSLSIPHCVEFIRAQSYEGTESTGSVKVLGLERVDVKGRHVLIVEDIVDTGLTLKALFQHFGQLGVASVKCCSFLQKETSRRGQDVPTIDYTAFTIPDKFVVGYGLDHNQRFRHLPFVGVFKQS